MHWITDPLSYQFMQRAPLLLGIEIWLADMALALRDEQSGKSFHDRPWLEWARASLTRKDFDVAKEQYEKGLVATPDHVDLLLEFAKLL